MYPAVIILEYPRAVTRGKIFIFTSFYYVHGVKRCLFSTFMMTQVDGFSQIVGCRVVLRLPGILGVCFLGELFDCHRPMCHGCGCSGPSDALVHRTGEQGSTVAVVGVLIFCR